VSQQRTTAISIGVAIAVLLGPGTAARAQDTTGVVTGIVRDQTGQPVVEALVAVDPDSASAKRARTDAEGRFRLVNIRHGRHEVQVVRLGFAPHYATIDVGPDEVQLTITMQHIPIQLDSIIVRAARSGLYGTVATRGWELMQHDPRPLDRVTVEVLDTRYRAGTSRDGRFGIPQLTEGAYSLLVRADGFSSRIAAVYIPPAGGVEVTVVLDSMVADYQRRDDFQTRDISRRIREADNPAALVGEYELRGAPGRSLRDALREAPSAISRGLIVKDDVSCLCVNGEPRPRTTADDILAEDVQSVEVYGLSAFMTTMRPPGRGYGRGMFCGTGTHEGPLITFRESYNVARVIIVWLKRRR
jgi:hypothetical protein